MNSRRWIFGALCALAIAACGTEDDGATLQWTVEPPGSIESGDALEASWTVDSSQEMTAIGLLACRGADPDCGLVGQDNIFAAASATLKDGVYSATLSLAETGRFTIVAYCDAGHAFVSPPRGVVVAPRAYPKGPYGNKREDTIENLSWEGYVDGDDADDNPFNDEPRQFALQELFVNNDAGAKVILLNSAAGWCGPCYEETRHMVSIYDQYYVRGARFVSTVFQDNDGLPATTMFAGQWGSSFGSKFPTLADPDDLLAPYYLDDTVPMSMFIDARSMEILQVTQGFNPDSMNAALDFYLGGE